MYLDENIHKMCGTVRRLLVLRGWIFCKETAKQNGLVFVCKEALYLLNRDYLYSMQTPST